MEMGGYEDDGSFSSLTESEIVLRSQQVHPAVHLRVLRLLASIRMGNKASWNVWRLLFAARNAKRSWIAALWEDVKWLAQSTSTSADLDT